MSISQQNEYIYFDNFYTLFSEYNFTFKIF